MILLVLLALFILPAVCHVDACVFFDVNDHCSSDGLVAEDTHISLQTSSVTPEFLFSEVLPSQNISCKTIVVSGVDRPPAQ